MQFGEARELLSDARETQSTVDFADDIEDALQAVNETVQMYAALLKEFPSTQERDAFHRENGQKVKQLEEELKLLMEAEH